MKLFATITAACLVATATALPVTAAADADADAGPARAFWGMPIVDHRPVPDTRRRDVAPRDPKMHIIEKIPVPEERRDAEVERRDRHRPVVDHRPVDRREEAAVEADSSADAEAHESTDSNIAKAMWGMPIIDHTPVPGTRRSAEGERSGRGFPVVDHRPVPDDK
ncbi:hypothetical protein ISF_08642 [Cordyceps fumosorosea ARSEF 2679]|uniref:Uncharacterized protein n=1 Tax=Cordyceps fumosorosea (strain ARSEF 2679) TaxID=1081104 RepID=A0A167LYW2_CORFA|nr:hypothetical protein ISF_08642 [Cordyceps fumosorosea ARSEF 2679]OAA53703.1 hypothetical protein ISF_08642 [Cordyceps fumosorosea ARSEF 2679]